MGRQKELYTQILTGYSENKEGIEFKGKVYKDWSTNNEYGTYSLIDCPICGEKMLELYEKDETPGFRDSSTRIVDRLCNCK